MFSPMSRRTSWSVSADDVVHADHRRLQHLPAAEREQLARERGGAVGGAADLLEVAAQQRVAVAGAGEREVGVAADRGEQVVEVVRDAAGELADGLHLLRLPELVLEPVPRGDVGGDGGVADDGARPRRGPATSTSQIQRSSPFGCTIRKSSSIVPRRCAVELLEDAGAVVGVDRRRPGQRVGVRRAERPAPQPLVRRADVEHLGRLRGDEEEDVGDRLGELPEARLALAQRLLGLDRAVERRTSSPRAGRAPRRSARRSRSRSRAAARSRRGAAPSGRGRSPARGRSWSAATRRLAGADLLALRVGAGGDGDVGADEAADRALRVVEQRPAVAGPGGEAVGQLEQRLQVVVRVAQLLDRDRVCAAGTGASRR